MIPGIDMEQVKAYNKSLKEYRDRAAKVQAGIEYSEKELARTCAELSTALGMTVTPDNIEQIRAEYINKINSVLATGTDIINRIRSEEAMLREVGQAPVTQAPQAPVTQAPQAPVTQAPVTQAPVTQAPQAPVTQAPQAPDIIQPPTSEVAQPNLFANLGDIPPMFNNAR